jgi:hypothetical protein
MRNIESNGRNMVVRTYPEVQEQVISYSKRAAWRKKNRGESVPPGELKGHSYTVNRLICWWMTLADEDRARIQDEGERLLERLDELPEDYEGGFPFGQRPAPVLSGKDSLDAVPGFHEDRQPAEVGPARRPKAGGEGGVVHREPQSRRRRSG